ncbi:MAG: tripartite tricarboxylate transporter TctB family protein [Limnochordia bacterium]
MQRADRIVACLIIIGCLLGYRQSNSFVQGADFFPKAVFAISMLLAVLLFVGSYFEKRTESIFAGVRWSRMIVTILFSVAYIGLIPRLGYPLSTTLFLFGLLLFLEERRPLVLTIIPVGMTGVLYVVFQLLLRVPIPSGSIW